jgi:glycosyltransferase involved in cell wall biosynthesis
VLEVAFAIPGDIATPTGGYAYDREILWRLPGLEIAAKHIRLPEAFPSPDAADISETARLFAELPTATILLIDGLAFGAMPAAMLDAVRQRIVALVHHPLGYEAGLSESRKRDLLASERLALAHTVRIVVPSNSIKRLLASEFGVAPDRIAVAEPGTNPAERACGSGAKPGRPLAILAVGAISPRKGYDNLVEALGALEDLDWRLTIAGATDRHEDAVAALKSATLKHGLAARVNLVGSLDEKKLSALYASADLFVLPSLFEGYGMVLAEAMAHGLPIVCTTGGAAAETVPDGAALKVAPGAAGPLAAALRQMLGDSALRRQIADASWRAGRRLPTWDQTAELIAAVLRDAAR